MALFTQLGNFIEEYTPELVYRMGENKPYHAMLSGHKSWMKHLDPDNPLYNYQREDQALAELNQWYLNLEAKPQDDAQIFSFLQYRFGAGPNTMDASHWNANARNALRPAMMAEATHALIKSCLDNPDLLLLQNDDVQVSTLKYNQRRMSSAKVGSIVDFLARGHLRVCQRFASPESAPSTAEKKATIFKELEDMRAELIYVETRTHILGALLARKIDLACKKHEDPREVHIGEKTIPISLSTLGTSLYQIVEVACSNNVTATSKLVSEVAVRSRWEPSVLTVMNTPSQGTLD